MILMQFESLYNTDISLKTRIWSARVFTNDNNIVCSEIKHGIMGSDKLQTEIKEYTCGKNIGKANETTPMKQCVNELYRKWLNKKEKEGYSESITDINVNKSIYPMLAHTYDPNKTNNKILFPCFVQPKLDGIRCIIYLKDNIVINQSRTGSIFKPIQHINDELMCNIFSLYPDLILDGELYTTEIPFEELAGIVKKKTFTNEDIIKLQKVKYYIYDIVDLVKTYTERYAFIQTLNSAYIVQTTSIASFNAAKEYFNVVVSEGYEGIMFRNGNGMYLVNNRSHDLQKYKEFIESEYEIVGYSQGSGRDLGTVIWLCKTPEGIEFSARPMGTVAYRKTLYDEGNKYIGKWLTVVYQELSEIGVPRFPVGKAIRDNY